MYVVTGMTGKVGGAVADTLLAAGKPVRAVVRNIEKARVWTERGCDVVQADMTSSAALKVAFSGAEAVFVLPPPEFDPSPDFLEARVVNDAVYAALAVAAPSHVVCLSTIGAQATQTNLLTQRTLLEGKLQDLAMPVTFLRPAWFIENAAWDVAAARNAGVIQSFLQPIDRPVPMVATADVGRVAAELMMQAGLGKRVVELEGPRRVSPGDIAAALTELVGHRVTAEPVPRDSWEALFRDQGMQQPMPRMRMLDGFNEGWIDFEGPDAAVIKGRVSMETVLLALVGANR